MNKIQGQFDPIDQEYTILDQLLLATKSIPESKQPPSRQGIVTRSMAKKLEQQQIPVQGKEEEKKVVVAAKEQEKRKVDKVPLYIGIAAESDKGFKAKLKNLFLQGFDQMAKKFPEQAKMFGKVSSNV